MKIALVFPTIERGKNGIGDYTLNLASALCHHAEVSVHVAESDIEAFSPRVPIQKSFQIKNRSGILELVASLENLKPNWIVLQYNPFSYGRYGINPYISKFYDQLRVALSSVKIATMIHEPFVPYGSIKLAVLSTIQRHQLKSIGKRSDLLFVSIEAWTKQFQDWFPTLPVYQLPVGSNITDTGLSKLESRTLLGIPNDAFVVGAFGTNHPSRLVEFIRNGFQRISKIHPNAYMLSLGSSGIWMSEDKVSAGFHAMDLYLAPFSDGVSARRTSFMVGIQHGTPSLATSGFLSDSIFIAENRKSFSLTPVEQPEAYLQECESLVRDPERRASYAKNGRELYFQRFDWKKVANQLVLALTSPYKSK